MSKKELTDKLWYYELRLFGGWTSTAEERNKMSINEMKMEIKRLKKMYKN